MTTTAITLSPLDKTEAEGITFSYVAGDLEMGVASFPLSNAEGAASTVRKSLELANVALVPRTQAAVDVMAEVLA